MLLRCESHLTGAALRSFKFFSPTAVCAAPNTEAFTLDYSISFQTEIISASTSTNGLYFGNRWTNTSASWWFLQLIYNWNKWRNQHWNPLISPLIVIVPSNPLNRIWFMSISLPCKTSQINLNKASSPLFPITSFGHLKFLWFYFRIYMLLKICCDCGQLIVFDFPIMFYWQVECYTHTNIFTSIHAYTR